LKITIHRGTKEIGGSCIEVWTEKTRILLDFGMPLIEKDGKEFDFNKYKNLKVSELIKNGVLPDIEGLYTSAESMIDAVIISHPHQDHYGLFNYINKDVKCYLGEATHKIIELNNLFTSQEIHIKNYSYFEKEKPFRIGDFIITPYWMDHSAFDSYALLVEAGDKSIFYSGDFRNHGRRAKVFKWFTYNAPQNVDSLLLEGTIIGRESKIFKSETEIENELTEVFAQKGKINLVYTSGQNIDRLVSIYKACNHTGRILVVDVYVATILKELSLFATLPFPSKTFQNVKAFFPYYSSRRLKREGNEKILNEFKSFEITTDEINNQLEKIVMIVRPSMQKDLELIVDIEGGNLIYSMWEGYLLKSDTKKFINYLTDRKFSVYKIHTSGHADISTLKKMVEAVKPKYIIPIHTFAGSEYNKIFSVPIIEMKDREIRQV
jgi:ribonuclease J